MNPRRSPEQRPSRSAAGAAVGAEQARLLYRSPAILLINPITAAVAAVVLWQIYPAWMVLVWLTLSFIVITARVALIRGFHGRHLSGEEAARWRLRFAAGSLASGCLWGLLGSVVFVTPDAGYYVFVVFALGGMTAGAAMRDSEYLPAFYGFAAPTILPIIAAFLVKGELVLGGMGVMLAAFAAVLVLMAHANNRRITDNIKLTLEQTSLNADLRRSAIELRGAEETAREGEARFRSLAENGIAGISISSEDGKIVYLNPRLANILGVAAAADAIGRSIFDFIAAADKPVVANAMDALSHARQTAVEAAITVLPVHGGTVSVLVQSCLTTFQGKRAFLAVALDVSERRAAEDRLQFANTLLTTIMETSPDGILVVDEHGAIISFNQRFIDIWRIPSGLVAERNDAPVLASVVRSMKDPTAFLARVEYLYAHPDETGHDELETNDGRFIDRNTAGLKTRAGQHLGRVWFFRDITDRRVAEEALRASEQRLQTIFGAVSDAIFVTDVATGTFVEVNRSGCHMFEYDREDLIGRDIGALSSGVPPYTLTDAMAIAGKARTEGPQTFEWRCRTKGGRQFWCEIALRWTTFGEREIVLATLRDITQRKDAQDQIVQMAHYDVLTGIANRRVFMSAVERAIARTQRGDKTFAVLYLDLDHFKDVNDTLGHPIGDHLLRAVAERLQLTTRKTDSVARFGGDEFAVIAAAIDEPSDAANLAEKLVDAIGSPYSIDGNEIRITASVGIAVYESDCRDPETLLSHADVALYRAKADGRAVYRFFTQAMDTEVRTRVSVSSELRDGMASGQIFLEYQPQVEAATGQIIGVEALVRWRHPVRGIVPPSEFIPVAEKTGLIIALDHWINREACRQGKAWLDSGVPPVLMSVNVSGAQFKRAVDLEADVAEVLAASGLPAHLLELELTETVLMETSQTNNDVLVRLRDKGIKLAIDDFGTGYSSLNYLRRFPVDRLKIAQEFVSDLTVDPGSAAIVRATIALARELGIAVLAEGVETEEQFELLKAWGCQEVQGYYFARPMAPEDLSMLLRRGGRMAPEGFVARTAA